jgi:hypothetical protein
MRTKVLLVPLVALLAGGVLTGCDPALPGRPSPSTPASADPTPSGGETTEPVDATTTPHHIGVSPIYISIFNADNLAYEVIHNGVSIEAVPVLTAAFGFEPTVSHVAGHTEAIGATVYDWSGFEYRIPDDATAFPPYSTWTVRVTTPAVNGIPIYTGDGSIQVGDPMSDAVAQQVDFMDVPASGGFPGFYYAFLLPQAVDAASVGEAPGAALFMYVSVNGAAGGGGAITDFVSPIANWGV